MIDMETIRGWGHSIDVHAGRMFCGRATGAEADIREIGSIRQLLQNPSFMGLEMSVGTVSGVILILPKVVTGYTIGSVGTGFAAAGLFLGVGGYFFGAYLRSDDVAYMLRAVKPVQQEQISPDTITYHVPPNESIVSMDHQYYQGANNQTL